MTIEPIARAVPNAPRRAAGAALQRAMTLVSLIHDAALNPASWPTALDAVAEACGAVGAAYIVRDKRTRAVDWISVTGPCAALQADYVAHYGPIDPYARVLEDLDEDGRWCWLSECLPDILGRGDPWYGDFVRLTQVGDVLGTRVLDTPTHVAFVGIHRAIGAAPVIALEDAPFDALTQTLCKAARLHQELRPLGWRSSVALQTLDRLRAGVIVTDATGRVVQLNQIAERLLREGDGLTVSQGRLQTPRAFESAKLAALIASAAGTAMEPGAGAGMGAGGRMMVARCAGRSGLAVSVAPLSPGLSAADQPLALVFVSDPQAASLSDPALVELFGLSRAECRLATALMAGKTLATCAASFGVKVSTLRTQLSSILAKVGVARQADLLRVLSGIQAVGVDATCVDAPGLDTSAAG